MFASLFIPINKSPKKARPRKYPVFIFEINLVFHLNYN